ncbi:MAG: purine-nucleoside phosphorylase, partial [Desulfatiglandales bacterium]
MFQKITEAADSIREKIKGEPLIGMITGTGLGSLTDTMEMDQDISYEQIPYFPRSTAAGHAGIL